ncbi:MAG: hypothetical protein ABSC55_12825 [Syntrophorhabdales bacterium]
MKKAKVTFVFICLGICLLVTSNTWAACQRVGTTCYPGSQSSLTNTQADVQDCVTNYAQAGDTVSIAAGTPTWAGPVIVANKNITIKGPDCTLNAAGQPTSCPLTITMSGNGTCTGCQWGNVAAFDFYTDSDSALTTGTSSAGTTVKKVSWRLHDLAITGNPGAVTSIINVFTYAYNPSNLGTDYPIMGWRIDHVKLDFSAYTNISRFFLIVGVTWGLVDHVNLVGSHAIYFYQMGLLNHEYYDGAGLTPQQSYWGDFAWSIPLHLGSDEALYVEDSLITETGSPQGFNDMASGASIVVRRSTIVGTPTLYSHTGEGGLLGRGGGIKYEFYNNQCDGSAGSAFYWMAFQDSGTGVIYNNKVTGYSLNKVWPSLFRATTAYNYTNFFYGNCWGPSNFNYGGGATRSYDGNLESNGWPCLDQLGRGPGVALGTAQPSVPLYVWNNGPQDACYTGSGSPACDGSANVTINAAGGTKVGTMADYIKTTAHSNGDKDYCIGTTTMPTSCGNHTNSYVAYTYPYPLQAGGGTLLAVPTNLRVTQ